MWARRMRSAMRRAAGSVISANWCGMKAGAPEVACGGGDGWERYVPGVRALQEGARPKEDRLLPLLLLLLELLLLPQLQSWRSAVTCMMMCGCMRRCRCAGGDVG